MISLEVNAETPLRIGLVGENEISRDSKNQVTGVNAEHVNCILAKIGYYKMQSLPSSARITEEIRKGGVDIGLFLGRMKERDQHAQFYDFGWKPVVIRLYSKLAKGKLRPDNQGTLGVRSNSPLESLAAKMGFNKVARIPKAQQLLGMLQLDRIDYYLEADEIFSVEVKKLKLQGKTFFSTEVKNIKIGAYLSNLMLTSRPKFMETWRQADGKCKQSLP